MSRPVLFVVGMDDEHGLPTPGLEPIATVEHKYWSRLVQQRVVPEVTPTTWWRRSTRCGTARDDSASRCSR